jgi:RNA polymerase sigma factor (sigma-70 family)
LLSPFQEVGRRTLRSFRLPAAEADDILSDVLTTLYTGGLAQFRGATMAELVGFLRAVIRNQAIDLLKEKRKWAEGNPGEAGQHAAGPDPFDISAGVADDECVEFLRQEVERLGRQDRELFLMKARGLKEREIAAQTGKPPGTIASQIARLLERLRSNLRKRGCV